MSNATSYKQQKVDFVSNLSGGSVAEVGLVTAVAPIAVLLWSVLQARQSFFRSDTPLSLAVDYALNVGAILLATTLYSSSPVLLILLLLAPVTLVYLLPPNADGGSRRRKPKVPPATAADAKGRSERLDVLPVKPFLTTYRGCMMVITCIAILAVDFRIFPRRFAKVETWGTSLMDMGVGSFVFASGVVAARPVLAERLSGRTTPLLRRLAHSARHSVPLLALGVVRLLSVKGLDYAEHVTEYGVHWNFFFTLGFLPPFVAACQAALRFVPSYAALALLIGGVYQGLLDKTGLKAYVLAAPRTDLISMNREGICSFFGYLAIFIAGQHLGMLVIPRTASARNNNVGGTPHRRVLVALAAWAAVWSALYWLTTSYSYGLGIGVSRRLANLPYVLWVAAFNSLQILAFCFIDTVMFPAFYSATSQRAEKVAHETATSRVLRAYNRNGLIIFLLANLLTGLVNMSVRTLHTSAAATMGILLAYTATVTGVAVALDMLNISIKL
ncbi:GPI-anchored wall transfer protein 1 [Hirsutella minnesotensis 3608]|nr:GPI-anchored wall transfer protein 1 [Hirsutella minnesotensis 3608]